MESRKGIDGSAKIHKLIFTTLGLYILSNFKNNVSVLCRQYEIPSQCNKPLYDGNLLVYA